MEVRYLNGGIGTGGFELWIDGVSQASDFSTYDTSSYYPDGLGTGIHSGDTPGNGATIYIDDIKEYVLAAEKIGFKGIHYKLDCDLKKKLQKLGVKID